MINFVLGDSIPPTYVNVVVLEAHFMHGDADQYTSARMVADIYSQEELHLVKAVWDSYESFPDWYSSKEIPEQITIHANGLIYSDPPIELEEEEDYFPGDNVDMELEDDMGIKGDLSTMFPWDKTQSEIGMYENRAKLEKYFLTYYDSEGKAFKMKFE